MNAPLLTLIQARMSSSRLPGKVLMPLGDGTVLDQVLRRSAAFSSQVVVCTSVDSSDDPIEAHCQRLGVLCVRGPLDDLFARFRLALERPDVVRTPWFARVTADCPLLSVDLALRLLAHATDDLDYLCVPKDSLPRGLTPELVNRATFDAIDHDSLDAPEKEHVTLRLYEKPGRYRCRLIEPQEALRFPEFRLTLDYEDDYRLLFALFEKTPQLTAEAAIARLRSDPALAAINATCEQKAVR